MTESRISASAFKAHCAEVIDGVAKGRGAVVITKRGRPVAKLLPIETRERKTLFGFAKGRITIDGDITAPIDVGWEAAK